VKCPQCACKGPLEPHARNRTDFRVGAPVITYSCLFYFILFLFSRVLLVFDNKHPSKLRLLRHKTKRHARSNHSPPRPPRPPPRPFALSFFHTSRHAAAVRSFFYLVLALLLCACISHIQSLSPTPTRSPLLYKTWNYCSRQTALMYVR
jgi:hypothetical protein